MQNSKFYALFSACTPDEIKGYHKFLRHNYPNRKDALITLSYLRKVHDTSDATSKLDMEFFYQKTYEKPLGDQRKSVSNTLSELLQLLKHYLLSERLKADGQESRSLWLAILKEKGLEGEFSKEALRYIKENESAPKKSLTDYLNLMILQHQYYYNFNNESELDGFDQIKKSATALEMYSQAIKYRMHCELTHLAEFLPPDSGVGDFIEKLKLQPVKTTSKHPILYLYNELSILLKNNDYAQFDRLSELIGKFAPRVSTKELDELLLFMNNFLSVLNRAGQSIENMERAHKLNKLALKFETYQLIGEMRIAHFLNIVTIACKVKDYPWALNFANKTQPLLPVAQGSDAVKLSKAIIQFEKQDYKGALKYMGKVLSKDVYIQYRARMLALVCHFELDTPDIDLVEHCTNTELYIKRNLKSLKGEVSSSGINFTRIVKMLSNNKAPKQKILDQINAAGSLVFREWLLEKAASYKQP
jgi:hypothetical protein